LVAFLQKIFHAGMRLDKPLFGLSLVAQGLIVSLAMEFAFPVMGKPPDSFSALMTPTRGYTFAGVL
jgi:hypothetical protein